MRSWTRLSMFRLSSSTDFARERCCQDGTLIESLIAIRSDGLVEPEESCVEQDKPPRPSTPLVEEDALAVG